MGAMNLNVKRKNEELDSKIKAVGNEKSDNGGKCELQVSEVEKRTLKKFKEPEREKKSLVLQEESKEEINAIKARPNVTNIEVDVTSDGELHFRGCIS